MRKIIIICVLFILGVYGISFFTIRKTGSYIVKQVPTYLTRLESQGIRLTYDQLVQDVCLTAVCLKATGATAHLFNQSLHLGTVRVRFRPTSLQKVVFETQPETSEGLSVRGQTVDRKVIIETSRLKLAGLQADFNGVIDLKERQITGTAQTTGLASFIMPYIIPQARFAVSLFIKDTPQTLEIGTAGQQLTLNGLPLLPLSDLFQIAK